MKPVASNSHTMGSAQLTSQEAALLVAIARARGKSPADLDATGLKVLKALKARGAIHDVRGLCRVTPEGKQALRRHKLGQEEERLFADQHQTIETVHLDGASAHLANESCVKGTAVKKNKGESPLQLLASRKRRDGSPYLDAHQVEAGERLRRDFELGQMSPALGINWSRLGEVQGSISRKAKGHRDGSELGLTAMHAQARFRAAIAHVGDEMAGILIDFCCFLKGLEEIERSRQMCARSAKEIVALALQRLARHYGLEEVATGPKHNKMQHWGTKDYRPVL